MKILSMVQVMPNGQEKEVKGVIIGEWASFQPTRIRNLLHGDMLDNTLVSKDVGSLTYKQTKNGKTYIVKYARYTQEDFS